MPGGNGTGPMGMGPMTDSTGSRLVGRGAGFCAGNGIAGYMNPVCGMGRGRGAWGRGRRNMFYATGLTGWQRAAGGTQSFAGPVKEQELNDLKGQAEYLENVLGDVRKRLQEMEADKSGK